MGLFRKKKTITPDSAVPAVQSAPDADPTPVDAPLPVGAPDAEVPDGDASERDDGAPPVDGLVELRAELSAMRVRLDTADRENAELAATVEALQQRLIVSAPPPPPPTSASTDAPDGQVASDELQRQLNALDDRVALLDARVTSVSTELANQVTELGNDIEPIQAGAERLAAEQARYQIQFRQDLAELAERLRRRNTP